MGQKIHPHGFRVGITEGWNSRWFAPKKLFGELLIDPKHFGDVSFSVWHYNNVRPDARVCWHVRPVHLHFDPPTFD